MNKKMFIFVADNTLKAAFLQVLNSLTVDVKQVDSPDTADIVLTDTAVPFQYLREKKPVLVLITSTAQRVPVPEWCVEIKITTAVAQILRELAKIKPSADEEGVEVSDMVPEVHVENPLRILVVEDNPKHQAAARKQLAGHNIEIVATFDAAAEVLEKRDFDVVLSDQLMPKGGTRCMGEKGMMHIFVQDGYGFAIAWIAVAKGIKHVAVLSDASHHDHPMSFAMDFLNGPVVLGETKVIFSNRCLISGGVKDWVGTLNRLI